MIALEARAERERATMRTDHQSLICQHLEISTDRGSGHIESRAKIGNFDAPVLLHELKNRLSTLLSEHNLLHLFAFAFIIQQKHTPSTSMTCSGSDLRRVRVRAKVFQHHDRVSRAGVADDHPLHRRSVRYEVLVLGQLAENRISAGAAIGQGPSMP